MPDRGLYQKYIVKKAEGKTDPSAHYIVLRIDSGRYVDACREGVYAFAERVKSQNPLLANDLFDLLSDYTDPLFDDDMGWDKPDCMP